MFCKSCGKKNQDGLMYCEYCGTKLSSSKQAVTHGQSMSSGNMGTHSSQINTPVSNMYSGQDNNVNQKPKSNTGLILGIGAVVVLICIVAGVSSGRSANQGTDYSDENEYQEYVDAAYDEYGTNADYEESQQGTETSQEILTKAQKYASEKQYYTAVKLCNDIAQGDKNYDKAQQMAQQFTQESRQMVMDSVTEELNKLKSNGYYDGAILTLNNYIESYSIDELMDMQLLYDLRETLRDEYVQFILQTVEGLKAEGDYDQAYEVIIKAQELVPERAGQLQTEADALDIKHRPRSIADFETYIDNEALQTLHPTHDVDALGNEHSVRAWITYYEFLDHYGDVKVGLDGVYTRYKGTVYVHKTEKFNESKVLQFQMIGDGQVLFDTGIIGITSSPCEFNIDVTGVQVLELKVIPGDPSIQSTVYIAEDLFS